MKRAIACMVLSLGLMGCQTTTTDVHTQGPPTEEAVKNVPLTADTHFAAAELAEAHGDADDAIAQYKAALKLNPNHVKAIYGLACLQVQLRQYTNAIVTWKKYVKATKGSAQAYCDLAYAEEWARQLADAKADYLRAIKADPKDENTRVNYGLMLARAGEMKAAADQLGVVLPESEVHYDLAAVYAARGNKMQAREEYQKAIDLDPDNSDARAKLAAMN